MMDRIGAPILSGMAKAFAASADDARSRVMSVPFHPAAPAAPVAAIHGLVFASGSPGTDRRLPALPRMRSDPGTDDPGARATLVARLAGLGLGRSPGGAR